jgi:hypothetical protein
MCFTFKRSETALRPGLDSETYAAEQEIVLGLIWAYIFRNVMFVKLKTMRNV